MWVAAWYVATSVITFSTYAIDKSAARRGAWRTPERTLHLLALAGGWPGALLAQQLLRHKTAKLQFRVTFWATVILNVAGFVGLCSPRWPLLLKHVKSQPGVATKSIAGCVYSTGAGSLNGIYHPASSVR